MKCPNCLKPMEDGGCESCGHCEDGGCSCRYCRNEEWYERDMAQDEYLDELER